MTASGSRIAKIAERLERGGYAEYVRDDIAYLLGLLTPERLTTALTDVRWWEQGDWTWTTPNLAAAILTALGEQG